VSFQLGGETPQHLLHNFIRSRFPGHDIKRAGKRIYLTSRQQFRSPQRILGCLPFRHIHDRPHQFHHLSGFVPNRFGNGFNVFPRAVREDENILQRARFTPFKTLLQTAVNPLAVFKADTRAELAVMRRRRRVGESEDSAGLHGPVSVAGFVIQNPTARFGKPLSLG
jgi:hypothetical protein